LWRRLKRRLACRGGALTVDGELVVGSDDTSTAFSGTIGDGINHAASVTKLGFGTLTLTGSNIYTGGTTIAAGVLSIGDDSALGDSSGPLTFNGGTLQTYNGVNSARAITLNYSGGTIDVYGNSSEFDGLITGAGLLQVGDTVGDGILTLSGANDYSGGTTINA